MATINNAKRSKQDSPRQQKQQTPPKDNPNFKDPTKVDYGVDDLIARQKRFLQAIFHALNGDHHEKNFRNGKLTGEISSNYIPQNDFEKIPKGQPIVFRHKDNGNQFSVTKDEIKFIDGNNELSFSDAMDMVRMAALDKSMMKDGITLNGTPKEKALLLLAVKEVNKEMGFGLSLKVKNKKEISARNARHPIRSLKNSGPMKEAAAERDAYLESRKAKSEPPPQPKAEETPQADAPKAESAPAEESTTKTADELDEVQISLLKTELMKQFDAGAKVTQTDIRHSLGAVTGNTSLFTFDQIESIASSLVGKTIAGSNGVEDGVLIKAFDEKGKQILDSNKRPVMRINPDKADEIQQTRKAAGMEPPKA